MQTGIIATHNTYATHCYTHKQFNDKYARGVIAALAAITKLRAAAITALPPTEIKTGSLKQSLATGGARRLAQANLHPINKVGVIEYVGACVCVVMCVHVYSRVLVCVRVNLV